MDGRCLIVFLSLTLTAFGVCAAQGEPPAADSQMTRGNGQGLIVLSDGKVLHGRFTPRPDGYDVQVTAGRMFISSDRILFIARDIHDAYQRMRSSQTTLTPETHVELARWCLANKLPDQAHREVLDALHLDPNRTDAKRMLAALTENRTLSDSRKSGSGLTEYPSIRKSMGTPIETRSLAGLSRTVAQDFTRHIQPLLMNKCANAGCHGGGTGSSFQLASAHRGSSPTIAERNLAAVLKHMDLASPASSPILVEVEGTHGSLNAPLFRGRTGAQQLDFLRNWVIAAAHDIAPDAAQESHQGERSVQLTSAEKPSGGVAALPRSMKADTRTPEGEIPHGRNLTSADTDQKFLAEAGRANARDEFDPNAFNARFHGSAGLRKSPLPSDIKSQPGQSELPAGPGDSGN